MTTLRRERIQKFEAIIQASDIYHYGLSHLENLGQGQFAEQMVKDLSSLLADAAASRTEVQQQEVVTAADRKVDAIIELDKQAKAAEDAGQAWRGREFLVGSEYLTYGDWWHKKTGLHMYGAKAKAKVSPDWLKAFREWADNELTVKSLEAAFEANKWRVISTPVVLTKDAIAIQAAPVVETTQREEGKSSGYYA